MEVIPARKFLSSGVVGWTNSLGPVARQVSTRDINMNELANVADMFEVCKAVPGVIACGGAVCTFVDVLVNRLHIYRTPEVVETSDLDLYIRARSQSEYLAKLNELLRVLKPCGKAIRTKFALTVYVDSVHFYNSVVRMFRISRTQGPAILDYIQKPPIKLVKCPGAGDNLCAKVQIVGVPIRETDQGWFADVERDVFSSYDLDCCKFATNGFSLQCTLAARDAVFLTRQCNLPWHFAGAPERLAKYYNRGYDFNITDLPEGVAIDKASAVYRDFFSKAHDGNMSSCTKGSFYDPRGISRWDEDPLDVIYKLYMQNGGSLSGVDPVFVGDVLHLDQLVQGSQPSDAFLMDRDIDFVKALVGSRLFGLFSQQHFDEISQIYITHRVDLETFKAKWCVKACDPIVHPDAPYVVSRDKLAGCYMPHINVTGHPNRVFYPIDLTQTTPWDIITPPMRAFNSGIIYLKLGVDEVLASKVAEGFMADLTKFVMDVKDRVAPLLTPEELNEFSGPFVSNLNTDELNLPAHVDFNDTVAINADTLEEVKLPHGTEFTVAKAELSFDWISVFKEHNTGPIKVKPRFTAKRVYIKC